MGKLIEFEVPEFATLSTCRHRGCKAQIVWKDRMPLAWNTVRIRPEDGKRVAQSHFADCIGADRFRKRARERRKA